MPSATLRVCVFVGGLVWLKRQKRTWQFRRNSSLVSIGAKSDR